MASTYNWSAQVESYTGQLGYSATASTTSIIIPLYLKEKTVPIRKPVSQQINTISGFDAADMETQVQATFFGAPEPLQTTISGWLITPTGTSGAYRYWKPTSTGDSSGSNLGFDSMSYADIIMAYTEGRAMANDIYDPWRRIDPTHYIDPYGNMYLFPKILNFEAAYTPVAKKQTFSMTLWLEPPTS